jgi:hypothetical protein
MARCCTRGLARASTSARWSTERPGRNAGGSRPAGWPPGKRQSREGVVSHRRQPMPKLQLRWSAACRPLRVCFMTPRHQLGCRVSDGLPASAGSAMLARTAGEMPAVGRSPDGSAGGQAIAESQGVRRARAGPLTCPSANERIGGPAGWANAHLGTSIPSGPVFTVRRSQRGAKARSSSCWGR